MTSIIIILNMLVKQLSSKIKRFGLRAFASHGNLSDQDRIFTNVYKDDDPFVDGALRRGDWH